MPRPITIFISVLLLLSIMTIAMPSEGNTNCPDSISNFDISIIGDCIIDTATTWQNGTITIAGNLIVSASLSLFGVTIIFDGTADGQRSLNAYDILNIQGGGIQSANSFHWRVSASGAPSATIQNAIFNRGTWSLPPASLLENNRFENVDTNRALDDQHMWVRRDSTIRNNVFDNISLYTGAAIVSYNQYGNILIEDNVLNLRCLGANCMGIENYGIHEDIVPIKPDFPSIEIRRNTVTWLEIASNTDSASYDNEYSMRLYVHNNTQYVNPAGVAPGEAITSPLEMGGVIDSIFENNTIYGPSSYGVYQYIYSDAGTIIQYNYFNDTQYAGIWQTGNNIIRHNTWENLTSSGPWLCPNSPCAGSGANTTDNYFYNNTFTFTPNPQHGLVRADLFNYLDNAFIGHGINYWSQASNIPGDWLFWADEAISELTWQNAIDGSRTAFMTFGGKTLFDTWPGIAPPNSARISVSGNIDRRGSSVMSGFSALWALDRDYASLNLNAVGIVNFIVDDFFADTVYTVYMDGEVSQFTTDSVGHGSFSKDFGSGLGYQQTLIEITGQGGPPPPPSDAITDLEILEVGAGYVLLGWSPPVSGNASRYDMRFATFQIDDSIWNQAIQHAIALPPFGRLNITGLSRGMDYWFAIKWFDGTTWSSISNIVSTRTL